MEKSKGHYLGTEIEEKWWKRCRRKALLARGWGECWQDKEGFYFLRYLTANPIFIPFSQTIDVRTGKWHSGRWMVGKDILKIVWEDEGQRLSSGFVLAGGNEKVHRLKKEIERLIGVKETMKGGP